MPSKSLGNVAITYGAFALAAYMDAGSIEITAEAVVATNLASTGKQSLPGVPEFSVPISGLWDKALDDVLGADAVSPPATLKNLNVQIGPTGSRVTYALTGTTAVGAFISDYKIDFSDTLGLLKWSGTLTVSGVPTRS